MKRASHCKAINSRPADIDDAIEDALYLQADKLLALCSVQAGWASSDYLPGASTRNHYSLVIEEQALALRQLLDRAFP